MTEDDFQRLAHGTRLSPRTLAACKDVLVDGVTGVEAAARHKTGSVQVSRGIGVLREREKAMVAHAMELSNNGALLKYTAAKVAESMLGRELKVNEPQPGTLYEGPIIVSTHGFIVQKIGRDAVIHDAGRLESVPGRVGNQAIYYPVNGERATVKDLSMFDGKSASKER